MNSNLKRSLLLEVLTGLIALILFMPISPVWGADTTPPTGSINSPQEVAPISLGSPYPQLYSQGWASDNVQIKYIQVFDQTTSPPTYLFDARAYNCVGNSYGAKQRCDWDFTLGFTGDRFYAGYRYTYRVKVIDTTGNVYNDMIRTICLSGTEILNDGIDQDCNGSDLVDRASPIVTIDSITVNGNPVSGVVGYNDRIVVSGRAIDPSSDPATGTNYATGIGVIQVFDATATPNTYLFDASKNCSNSADCNWQFTLQFPGSYSAGTHYTFKVKVFDKVNITFPYDGSNIGYAWGTLCLSAPEACNGVDDNCNGQTDEGLGTLSCGVGACSRTVNACVNGVTQVCTPGSPSTEVCDSVDNDCDGSIDESLSRQTTCGVGACASNTGTETCTSGTWGGNTCNPTNGATAEVCNNVDDDCNGSTDENISRQTTCGVGACANNTGAETCTSGVWGGDTCNPSAGATPEVCDGSDNDCDGTSDEGVGTTYYADVDSDCYGNLFSPMQVCGVVCQTCGCPTLNSTDCNDGNISIYPGALELCNGIDDNCNGQIDENVTYSYYTDMDGDGYGDAANSILACSQPQGYVTNNTDCNDNDANIHPGATDIPDDGIDQDCSGADSGGTSKLGNISTRGMVETGDRVMIGGFIISGSAPRSVLIRGFGPTLADFGVTGALVDPYIELYSDQTMIATNDNWQTPITQCDAPAVSCGTPQDIQTTGKDACSVATTGCSQDAAILVTLPPGAYTVIMRGVGGGTGVGLIGVDDNDTNTLSKLVNISTRGPVLTDERVMIGGFIIDAGTGSKKVLIRGFGPTLADFGVPGALADPYIELYSSQSFIASNDNWQEPITQCYPPLISCDPPISIQATGKDACSVATTGCTLDAALLVTLPSGAYTAILRGVGGGTGVGLVGIDEIGP